MWLFVSKLTQFEPKSKTGLIRYKVHLVWCNWNEYTNDQIYHPIKSSNCQRDLFPANIIIIGTILATFCRCGIFCCCEWMLRLSEHYISSNMVSLLWQNHALEWKHNSRVTKIDKFSYAWYSLIANCYKLINHFIISKLSVEKSRATLSFVVRHDVSITISASLDIKKINKWGMFTDYIIFLFLFSETQSGMIHRRIIIITYSLN